MEVISSLQPSRQTGSPVATGRLAFVQVAWCGAIDIPAPLRSVAEVMVVIGHIRGIKLVLTLTCVKRRNTIMSWNSVCQKKR